MTDADVIARARELVANDRAGRLIPATPALLDVLEAVEEELSERVGIERQPHLVAAYERALAALRAEVQR
jgi:hypothetical protein